MGCASSKQKRCRHCQNPYSPVPRSYSMNVHHLPQSQGDSYHVVALTSSTLGSLKLESTDQNGNAHINDLFIANGIGHKKSEEENEKQRKSRDFSVGLIEAKTWSHMINQKIPKTVPKTPVRTPPEEPETINAWELMEGLEDSSPFKSLILGRSFSFDIARNLNTVPTSPIDRPMSRLQENGTVSPKPMWLQMEDREDFNTQIPEFDSEIISKFRKSLDELSPENGSQFQSVDNEKEQLDAPNTNDLSLDDLKKVNDDFADHEFSPFSKEKDKLVLYFTSLRGVRKTFEDCCHVRVILKGLGIRVDERDVSMHSGFKEELKELLIDGFFKVGLPRVFIGKKYIGGAEEIRKLHEDGQLAKMLECCEKMDNSECGGGGGGTACEACGDIRFVPCETCSGSCKIYYEEEEKEEEMEKVEEGGYGFQRCPDCNENGLIRCPICCY